MFAYGATDVDVYNASGLVKAVFGMIDDIFNMSKLADISDLLIIDFSGSTLTAGGITFTTLTTVLRTVYRVFQNLGLILMIIFFCAGLLESISFQQMYLEKLVRQFVFFCLGVFLLSRSMELVFGIATVFSAVIEKIISSLHVTVYDMRYTIMDLKRAIYDNCNVRSGTGLMAGIRDSIANLTTALSYLVQLFIPSLIGRLANIVVSVVCWSRFVELTILAVISPLMFCDITSGNGLHSNSMRAVKSVIALALSGAVIMLAVFICQQIEYGILAANALNESSMVSCVWKEIVVAIVEVGLVGKAMSLAQRVITA